MPSYATCFVMFCQLLSIPNSFVAIMGNIHLIKVGVHSLHKRMHILLGISHKKRNTRNFMNISHNDVCADRWKKGYLTDNMASKL